MCVWIDLNWNVKPSTYTDGRTETRSDKEKTNRPGKIFMSKFSSKTMLSGITGNDDGYQEWRIECVATQMVTTQLTGLNLVASQREVFFDVWFLSSGFAWPDSSTARVRAGVCRCAQYSYTELFRMNFVMIDFGAEIQTYQLCTIVYWLQKYWANKKYWKEWIFSHIFVGLNYNQEKTSKVLQYTKGMHKY